MKAASTHNMERQHLKFHALASVCTRFFLGQPSPKANNYKQLSFLDPLLFQFRISRALSELVTTRHTHSHTQAHQHTHSHTHILTYKKRVMSMRAHAGENVASWLRQDQLFEHNMPSTKHISFLDPLLLQSDNTTQPSTAPDNTTQDIHKEDTQAYSCRLHILLNASLELHFTKENARTSRAAGRNARTMARRCIRLACSIYIYIYIIPILFDVRVPI